MKLVEMKNLGASSINLLADIGIRTPEDLCAIGSVKAFRRIRQRGIRVSVALLYALEGAILDIAWQDMDCRIKNTTGANGRANQSGGKHLCRNQLHEYRVNLIYFAKFFSAPQRLQR